MLFRLVVAGLAAYLLGSLNFGVIISKLVHHDDVRRHGSGNAGMTNALRVYGGKTAVWVFVGDFLKGALAVWLGGLLYAGWGMQLAALAVVLGHLFPVFFSFHGGKGVATAAGAILVLNPPALVALMIPFGLILLVTRYMSLASVTVACLFPLVTVALFLFSEHQGLAFPWPETANAVVIGGLVVWMHRDNIRRLCSGTERKLGQRSEGR